MPKNKDVLRLIRYATIFSFVLLFGSIIYNISIFSTSETVLVSIILAGFSGLIGCLGVVKENNKITIFSIVLLFIFFYNLPQLWVPIGQLISVLVLALYYNKYVNSENKTK